MILLLSGMDKIKLLIKRCHLLLTDFDGVFADTEPLHARAYASILATLGVQFRESDFSRYLGYTEPEIWAMLASNFQLAISPEELTKKRIQEFINLAKGLKPSWFLEPLLKYAVRDLAIPTIVVSSQRPDLIERLLSDWHLMEYHLELATFYNRGKTKRELIQILPTTAGVPFDQCLLVEDSAVMLQLAREVGMKTIGIRHTLNRLGPGDCDLLLNIQSAAATL
jgi:beta-phosphoglucomutase-like phosphatase (HAD superfamily)